METIHCPKPRSRSNRGCLQKHRGQWGRPASSRSFAKPLQQGMDTSPSMGPKPPPPKGAPAETASSSSYATPSSAPTQQAKLPQKAMPAKAAPKPSRPPPSEKPQQAPQKKKKTNQWSTRGNVANIIYFGYGWWWLSTLTYERTLSVASVQ